MDRAQVWKITADFGSLSRQAGTAARKLRELDAARVEANKNSNRHIFHEKEADQLEKLTQALAAQSAARKASNAEIKKYTQSQQQSIKSTTRASTAKKMDAEAMNEQALAASAVAAAFSGLSGSVDSSTKSVNKHTKAMKSNKSQIAQTKKAASDLASGTGFLLKAFTDILPVSRSWSLIMKMLPLTAVASAVNSLAPAIAGLGGAFVGLMGSIAPVFSTLGALPTLFVSVAGAAGGVIGGITGIAGAMKAYTEMTKAQEKAERKGTKTSDAAAKARAKREKALQKSLRNAERDQVRNAQAILDAEQKLADTLIDNAYDLESALLAVKEAQLKLAEAQEGITGAREKAIKVLEEYKDKVRDAFLEEESAAQALESARASLAKTLLDPGSTDYETRAADLAVRQAEARLKDLQKTNLDLQKDADDANKKGIEGSDALKDANYDAEQAALRLARAMFELSKTKKDNAKSERDARRGIEDANTAYADGADRIAELKQELADLRAETDETGSAMDSLTEKTKEFEEALAKLSKSGQDTVKEMIKLKDAWTEMSKAAEAAMSPGLLSFFQNLNTKIFPLVSTFLVKMAGGAGEFAASLGELLSTDKSLENLALMMEDSYDVMSDLGEATLNVVEWLLGLGAAAKKSGLTKWISNTLKLWTRGWADATNTPEGLTKTVSKMENGMDAMRLWGRAIKDTWKWMGSFFRAFKPLGDWVLGNISETTKAWKNWIESDPGTKQVETWIALAKVNLSGLTKAIGTVVDQGEKMFKMNPEETADFWETLNKLINRTGDVLGMASQDMVVNLIDMGEAIIGILEGIGKGGAMDMMVRVVGLFGDLLSFVDGLIVKAPILGAALSVALGFFSAKKMIVGLGALMGVTPIFEAIGRANSKGYTKGNGRSSAAFKEYMGFGNFNLDRTNPQMNALYDQRILGKSQVKDAKSNKYGANRETRAAIRDMTAEEYKEWKATGGQPMTVQRLKQERQAKIDAEEAQKAADKAAKKAAKKSAKSPVVAAPAPPQVVPQVVPQAPLPSNSKTYQAANLPTTIWPAQNPPTQTASTQSVTKGMVVTPPVGAVTPSANRTNAPTKVSPVASIIPPAAQKTIATSAKGMSGLALAGSKVAGAFRGIGSAAMGFLGPIGIAMIAIGGITAAISFLDAESKKGSKSVEDLGKILDRSATNAGAWDEIFEGWSNNSFGALVGTQVKDVTNMTEAMERFGESSRILAEYNEKALPVGPSGPGRKIEDAAKDLGTLQKEFQKVDEASRQMDFGAATRSIAYLTDGLMGAGASARSIQESFPSMAAQAKTALNDVAAAGYPVTDSVEEVAKVLRGDLPEGMVATTEGFKSVKEALEKGSTIIGGKLTSGLYRLKDGTLVAADSQEALAERSEKVNAAQKKQAEQVEKTAEALKKQKEQVDALNEAQKTASTAFMDAEAAQAHYSELLRGLGESLDYANRGIKATKDGFDVTSASGAQNAAAFRDIATAARENTDSMLANGTSVEDVNAAMQVQRDNLIKNLKEFGFSEEGAKKYADQLGLIPNYVGTKVYLANANITQEELLDLQSRIAGMDSDIKVQILTGALQDGYEKTLEYIDRIPKDVNIGVSFGIRQVKKENPNMTGYEALQEVRNNPRGRATGGAVFGPGTSTSDSIPALLSDGEYVIKASSAKSIGMGALHAMNRTGKIPGFKAGGPVTAQFQVPTSTPLPNISSSSGPLNEVFQQIFALEQYMNNSARFMNSWGNNLSSWWSALWGGLASSLGTSLGTLNSVLNTKWSAIWASANLAAASGMAKVSSTVFSLTGSLINGVAKTAPLMGSAWTQVMDAMKLPVKNAVDFLNNTLGTVVTTVSKHYGVDNSPFPVSVAGFSSGGWTGPGSKYTPAGIVHADEFVISKSSRRAIESQAPGLLDHMNKTGKAPGYATGGRVKPVGNAAESGNYSGHSGIDYRVGTGTPVRAADGGSIISTPRLNRSYGFHVVQRLAGGLRAVYAHLSEILTSPGALVKRGEVIGKSGNTGNSKGPHLHFEVAPGSLGATSNRAYTRSWLGGSAVDPSLVEASTTAAGASLADAFGEASMNSLHQKFNEFTNSNTSPWGKVVNAIVGSVANLATSNLGDDGSIIPITGTASGDSSKVKYKGGIFSSRFAAAIQAAEKMAGVGFHITQGGFRPRTPWSGTSHQGDAVDIGSPISAKVVNALRANGIAAWDRTGQGKWEPHIHGVPLPGFGFGAGSAPWQAAEYLSGRDGLGRKSRKKFATGGWTGPGGKYKPAGIVHADEFVVSKSSRRAIEAQAPGLLDHMNKTGNIPGYAEGGKVKPFTVPRTLKNLTVYTSYLRKAQQWDAKNPNKRLAELVPHVQMIENLLAHEGLLWRKDANGIWNSEDVKAWKAWQKKNEFTENGQLDDTSVLALLKKYGIKYNSALPWVSGITQPNHLDVMQSKLNTTNKQDADLKKFADKFKNLGLNALADFLNDLGPSGIPEEFRDSTDPITGLQLAERFSKDTSAARKYNEALKKANKYAGKTDALTSKLEEMLELIVSGPNGPYGLQGLARELGVSIDTTAVLYRKLLANGSLNSVPSTRTNRLKGDVVNFDNLFKFAKGGLVPGTGNEDSVLAWLTPGELVVPKDVVRGMFSPTSPRTSYTDFATTTGVRKSTGNSDTDNRSYTFITNNPAPEPASESIQKRVRTLSEFGIF